MEIFGSHDRLMFKRKKGKKGISLMFFLILLERKDGSENTYIDNDSAEEDRNDNGCIVSK